MQLLFMLKYQFYFNLKQYVLAFWELSSSCSDLLLSENQTNFQVPSWLDMSHINNGDTSSQSYSEKVMSVQKMRA